jgi:hypothetical protein
MDRICKNCKKEYWAGRGKGQRQVYCAKCRNHNIGED